jgi:hypothetical protein
MVIRSSLPSIAFAATSVTRRVPPNFRLIIWIADNDRHLTSPATFLAVVQFGFIGRIVKQIVIIVNEALAGDIFRIPLWSICHFCAYRTVIPRLLLNQISIQFPDRIETLRPGRTLFANFGHLPCQPSGFQFYFLRHHNSPSI